MKRTSLILLLLVLTAPLMGQIADFKLKDIDNRSRAFSELQGEKMTLIDFWATWCKPCLQAIPKLTALYERYQQQGVQIIGVNVDSPRNAAKVKPFVQTYNITYPVLRDPNSEVAVSLNVSSFPTLYIVNAQREIVYTHLGFRPGDEKLIEEEIERLLAADDDQKE